LGFCNFPKELLPKVNNHPRGKNSPNLFTLHRALSSPLKFSANRTTFKDQLVFWRYTDQQVFFGARSRLDKKNNQFLESLSSVATSRKSGKATPCAFTLGILRRNPITYICIGSNLVSGVF
jgi:hypothetical protein